MNRPPRTWKSKNSLCFISWTASVGQLEHIRENMRTTMMNIPELRIGGVTTKSCWIFVNKSLEATCCSKFFKEGTTKWETLVLERWALKRNRVGGEESRNAPQPALLPLHAGSCPLAVQNTDKCFQQTFCPVIRKFCLNWNIWTCIRTCCHFEAFIKFLQKGQSNHILQNTTALTFKLTDSLNWPPDTAAPPTYSLGNNPPLQHKYL